MYSKRTESGQDIFDMTIQEYGYIDLLFVMLDDNGLEPTNDLETGQVLSFREVVPNELEFDAERLDYFRRNEIRVNTHYRQRIIGWWETMDGDYYQTQDGDLWQTMDGVESVQPADNWETQEDGSFETIDGEDFETIPTGS